VERVVSKKGGDNDDKGEVLERKVEDFPAKLTPRPRDQEGNRGR
jgi:tRNA pseudouridine55 synthase